MSRPIPFSGSANSRLSEAAPRGWRSSGLRIFIYILAMLVALASYRHLFGGPLTPDIIMANAFRPGWLALHAGFAATALLVGPLQFSERLRERRRTLHRTVGVTYVVACLIGAVSGIVLAVGSAAGAAATAGFGLLGIAWFATSALGWWYAATRLLATHRRWMIRSWALTLSAVTLRIYLTASEVSDLPENESYVAISFLCWVPNMAAAELYLRWDGRRVRDR